MAERDWYAWHDRYSEPASLLAQRLAVVQDQIRRALDGAPPGPLRVVSVCAGQGRELLGVLPQHPRRDEVTARLIELDPRNAAAAADTARAAGLEQVEVVTGDAALVDHYVGMVPADLVIASGIFGNVTDADVRGFISYCPRLCRSGGTVVWTRHRRPPDLVPEICRWFGESGFELVWLSSEDAGYGVGVHRAEFEPSFSPSPSPSPSFSPSPSPSPSPLPAGARMFTFVS